MKKKKQDYTNHLYKTSLFGVKLKPRKHSTDRTRHTRQQRKKCDVDLVRGLRKGAKGAKGAKGVKKDRNIDTNTDKFK